MCEIANNVDKKDHQSAQQKVASKEYIMYEFISRLVQKCRKGRTCLLSLTLTGLFIALGHFLSVKHNYFALHALKLT